MDSEAVIPEDVLIAGPLEVGDRDAVPAAGRDVTGSRDPIPMTKNCDFAIYCNAKKSAFFSVASDWKYRIFDELNAPEPYSKFRFVAQSLVGGPVWQVAQLSLNGGGSASGPVVVAAVSASSNAAQAAAALMDGSGATTWSSSDAGYSRDALSGLRGEALLITVDALTKQHYVGDFLQVQLPAAVAVNSYTMRLSASSTPSDWHVMGSSDGGATWRNVASRTGYVYASGSAVSDVTFPVSGTAAAYSCYRVVFSRLGADAAAGWIVALVRNLRFYSVSTQTGATLTHPPNLTGVVTTISGQTEAVLNGYYEATTSLVGGGVSHAWYAFDASASTYWATDAGRYARAPGAAAGTYDHVQLRRQVVDAGTGATSYAEWLQVQLPAAVALSGYDLRAAPGLSPAGGQYTPSLTLECAPKDWLLMGSNDGSGWYVVDRRTGFDGWLAGTASSFDLSGGAAAYSQYRLAVQRLVYAGGGAQAAVAEWRLRSVDAGSGATLVFPPAPAPAPAPLADEPGSFTVSGQAFAAQNGTYTLNASSCQAATPSGAAGYAFDGSAGTAWRSATDRYLGAARYGRPACQYTPLRTQDAYFSNYFGEWIDVTLSGAAVLQSYALTPPAALPPGAAQASAPGWCCAADLAVLGSNDGGASWQLLDAQAGLTGSGAWPAPLAQQASAPAASFSPAYGRYAGSKLMDGHKPQLTTGASGCVPLTGAVVDVAAARAALGVDSDRTRFVHYKQCSQFFRCSFKVGDRVSVPVLDASGASAAAAVPLTYTDASGASWPVTRPAQLYAVYLDSTWGTALPYWKTAAATAARLYYYADLSGAVLDGIALGASGGLTAGLPSTLDGSGATAAVARVTVVAPPDPDFLDTIVDSSGATAAIGGSLCLRKDASGNLVIRRVGPADASGNGLLQYTQVANFAPYTTDAGRALLLYWLVGAPASGTASGAYPPYMGEQVFLAFSSQSMQVTPGGWRPIRDMYDPVTESYRSVPSLVSQGYNLEADKFVLSSAASGGAVYAVRESVQLRGARAASATAAPQLSMPLSRYFVATQKPAEADAPAATVPFAYAALNQTDFGFDRLRSTLGGRLMQLLAHYLFDAAGNRETAYFPMWLSESKRLTDKVVDALAALLGRTTLAGSQTRTSILRQVEAKYGRKPFDDCSSLNAATNERTGSVWGVLQRVSDLYVFFLVTLRTTVALRAKDDVEVLRFEEIPVVLHLTG